MLSVLGPKMGQFGKYILPMTYTKFKTSDVVVKTRKPDYCTVFDVSHMAIFETQNAELIEAKFMTYVPKKNKSKLAVNLDHNGKVIDDLIIGNINNEKFRLVVNANTKELYRNVFQEIPKKIIAIQGDHSQPLVEELLSIKLDDTFFMNNKTVIDNHVEICRCGYTGEDGFELYLDSKYGDYIMSLLIERAINDERVLFGGLIERDLLRLEAGLCLSGTEFGEHMNINFDALDMNFLINKKNRDKKQYTSDLIRVGLTSHKPIRTGVLKCNNDEYGLITSANKSFNLDKFIALGYINKNYTDFDEKFLKITKLPFVETNYFRQKDNKANISK